MKISLVGIDTFWESIIASAVMAESEENVMLCFCSISEYLEDEADSPSEAVFLYARGSYALREACRKIRRKDEQAKIIVVSDACSCVAAAFEMKVFQYFSKATLNVDAVVHELDRVRREFADSEKFYTFKKRGYKIKVNISEVVYLETKDRYVYFYMADGTTVNRKGKLDDMERYFEKNNFIRIHKSFMVNIRYVEKQTKSYMRLKVGGRDLPVSRKYKEAASERFAEMSTAAK